MEWPKVETEMATVIYVEYEVLLVKIGKMARAE